MSSGLYMLWVAQVVDDMKDFGSWAYGYGCYEKLRFMDEMNNSGSHELKALNDLKRTGL